MTNKLSSISETIVHFFNSKLISSSLFSNSSSINNNNHKRYLNDVYIDTEDLYDLLQLIFQVIDRIGNRTLINDLLLILFTESRQRSPDILYIFDWIKTNLWVIIGHKDVELLIKYVKLFRPLPSEIISEYDAFERVKYQNPLLVFSSTLVAKEVWCEKTHEIITERRKQIFWDQATLNHQRKTASKRLNSLIKQASITFNKSNRVTPSKLNDVNDSIRIIKVNDKIKRSETEPTDEILKSKPMPQQNPTRYPFDRSRTDPQLRSKQNNFVVNFSVIESVNSYDVRRSRSNSQSQSQSQYEMSSCMQVNSQENNDQLIIQSVASLDQYEYENPNIYFPHISETDTNIPDDIEQTEIDTIPLTSKFQGISNGVSVVMSLEELCERESLVSSTD